MLEENQLTGAIGMANLDMKKTLKHLYKPSDKKISIVDVQPLPYLMIDGEGNPGTAPRYQEAVESLYSIAYGIRFMRKAEGEVFTVMPLEGLWWFKGSQDVNFNPTEADKDRFIWTLMILQPESITPEIFAQARENARAKKSHLPLDDVRFETYHEGDAVQLMHIGAYSDEARTVSALHSHIEENGWQLAKKHHEIYLSDPRKVAPEKLKTVIRQPFTR